MGEQSLDRNAKTRCRDFPRKVKDGHRLGESVASTWRTGRQRGDIGYIGAPGLCHRRPETKGDFHECHPLAQPKRHLHEKEGIKIEC